MLAALRVLNLAVAFFLELAVLVAAGYWGFTLPVNAVGRLLTGLGVPLVFAVLWGVFASPKAPLPLDGLARAGFMVAWFGAGVALLALAGRAVPAVVLGAVYVVNTLMLRLLPE